MKTLLLSDIYAYVKARLDEISNNEDASLVMGDQAVEDLEKVIKAVTVHAVRKIHLEAPNILLKDGVSLSGSTTPSSTALGMNLYKHSIDAPATFLRLVSLKLPDWSRPIHTLVGQDSAEYRKQGNIYLMGTPSKPVGALVHGVGSGVGNGVMELYTSSSSTAVAPVGSYVPEPTITTKSDVDSVDVIATLEFPCLDQITAETLRSIGRHQEAQVYDRSAARPFYIDPEYARTNPVASERVNAVNG